MSGEMTFLFTSVVTLVAGIRLLIRVHKTDVFLEVGCLIELLVTYVALKLLCLQVDCVQMFLQRTSRTEPLLASMTLMFGI